MAPQVGVSHETGQHTFRTTFVYYAYIALTFVYYAHIALVSRSVFLRHVDDGLKVDEPRHIILILKPALLFINA